MFNIDIMYLNNDDNSINLEKPGKQKYLITNTNLELKEFTKLCSINCMPFCRINNCIFFLYFKSIKEYSSHIKKIKKYNGDLISKNLFICPKYVKTILKFDIKFLSNVPSVNDNFRIVSEYPKLIYKDWLSQCKKNEFVHIELELLLSKKEQYIRFIDNKYFDNDDFIIKNIEFSYNEENMSENKKKIALVYRGFYKRNYSRHCQGTNKNSYDLDYLNNHLNSIKSTGISNIDIYFHSYSYDKNYDYKILKLLSNYNLKDFRLAYNVKNPYYSLVESLKLVKEEYEYIISTRFDIFFIKQLKSFNIEEDKFNFTFKDHKEYWLSKKKTSDLIYIFPNKYTINLINATLKTNKYDPHSFHLIYNHLNLIPEKINFMIEGYFTSNTDKQNEKNLLQIKESTQNNYIYIKRENNYLN